MCFPFQADLFQQLELVSFENDLYVCLKVDKIGVLNFRVVLERTLDLGPVDGIPFLLEKEIEPYDVL